MNVASSAKLRGELVLFPSSCGGSAAVSLTVRRSVKEQIVGSHTFSSPEQGAPNIMLKLRTELGIIPLVEEDLPTNLLNDYVPAILALCAAHQRCENAVGCEHVRIGVGSCQLPDDGIVGGGDGVEDAVNALQRPLVLHVDAIVGLLVVLHRSARVKVRRIADLQRATSVRG